MERQLWKSIVAVLGSLGHPAMSTSFDYSDEWIVAVWYWAVIHDRPVSWACVRGHWPLDLRKRRFPTPSTMSRRLASPSVQALLCALEQRVIAPREPGLFWMIDGKPLPIGGCSKDPDARCGRAARGLAVGYKLHALVNSTGNIGAWRVQPMNVDERAMAEELLATPGLAGYVVADANYDSNRLHQVCDQRGNVQLVTPRRYGPANGTGHRRQTLGRLRSIAITENPNPDFGRQLLADRCAIERHFGNLTNWGGGLTCLPPWIRTLKRVRPWVQAKLVIAARKRLLQTTTCVA